jgi:serine/threonine-protein kinase
MNFTAATVFQPGASDREVEPCGPLSAYEIQEVLRSWKRGELYRGRDSRHDRIVTVRVLAPECTQDLEARRQLLEAGELACALSHPHVAATLEVGEDRGHLYLVVEHVKGRSLREILDERRLSSRRAIELTVQIADAIADAHSLGIVHGELTADHVLVTATGNAKVLRCGLASWTHAARAMAVAQPAVESHEATDDEFSGDVAAIGTLLLEMSGGRRDTNLPGQRRLPERAGTLPLRVDPDVPPELAEAVQRAVAAEHDRCGSAAALAAELAAVAAILDVRSKASAPARTTASWRRGEPV